MDILKSIARKILAKEIGHDLEEIEKLKKVNEEFKRVIFGMKSENLELYKKKLEVDSELSFAENRVKDLEKENEMLREYYKLDEEPSEETQFRIHINLELNRLKEELFLAKANSKHYSYPTPTYQPIMKSFFS